MQVHVKAFTELRHSEVYSILKLRFDVFVIEQNCIYNELDGKDQSATHIFIEQQSEIIAYCRMIKLSDTTATMGRIVVRKPYRGKGFGEKIIRKAIEFTSKRWNVSEVFIHAQKALQEYYESYGFIVMSKKPTSGTIPHIDMKLQI